MNDELKEKIATIIMRAVPEDKYEFAQDILSLQVGEREEKCPECGGIKSKFINPDPCHMCHGKYSITRPITIAEAVEGYLKAREEAELCRKAGVWLLTQLEPLLTFRSDGSVFIRGVELVGFNKQFDNARKTLLKQEGRSEAVESGVKVLTSKESYEIEELKMSIGVLAEENKLLTRKAVDDAWSMKVQRNALSKNANEIATLQEEADRHKKALEALISAATNMIDIANESEGVSGWHMNGDLLLWGQCEPLQELEGAREEAEKAIKGDLT
ncbi:MAG: hypothetical protein PHY29_02995 [Syntrophales bacterium]|nr:hypothetical protein [Syntrophales bacterium]